MQASAEPDPDMISFLIDEIPRSKWREWANTVPRATSLQSRIYALISMDSRLGAVSTETDLVELAGPAFDASDEVTKVAHLKGERVGIRAQEAINALDRNNAKKARDEMEKVIEISEGLTID